MSIQPLPSLQVAESMLFPDLARSIRENLGHVRVDPNHQFDRALVRKLLSILQEKARSTSARPPRPTFPPPPVRPTIHRLPKLRMPNSLEFQRCQADFVDRIKKAEQELLRCPDSERKE